MAQTLSHPVIAAKPAALPRTHPDLQWLLTAAGLLVALCGLPYVVSALFGPPDLQRIGTFWFARDFSQYEAAMRDGARQAGWLVHDRFSAEPHQAAFIYPLYVGAGKLAAQMHVEPLMVFATLEWVGRLSLLGALYAFAATFVHERAQRQLAVALAAGSLGLVGLIAPVRLALDALGAHTVSELLPSSINVYLELSSFGVFLAAPHLMLGLALTVLSGVLYLRRGVIGTGLAVLALSLLHPFNLPVLVSVLVIHAAWCGRRWWAAAGVAALAAAPVTLYNLVLFTRDPFWSGTYGTQNTMPAPAPWGLPVDLGLVLLAAPLAWGIVRSWPAERRRFILLWIGLGVVWLYAPVPFQRRFAFGVQPALAILAAAGLVELNRRWHSRPVNYALAVAVLATPVLVYIALVASAAQNSPSEVYVWSGAEAAAADWISAHSTADDVVMASTPLANPLVGVIDGRVVHGHIVATLNTRAKEELVQRFYAADTTPAERSELLREAGATLVAFGPRERALGALDLSSLPGLDLQYDAGGVQVFRVR